MNEIFLTALEISAATSVVIILVALLSKIIDKKFSAGWKYWIWLLIALRLIIPFNPETEIFQKKIEVEVPDRVIYVPQENPSTEPEFIVPPDAQTGAQTGAQPSEPSETILPEEKTESRKSATFLDFASAIWLCGAGIFFLWNTGAYLSFRKAALRCSKPAKPETHDILSGVKASLGIEKDIEILICKNVKSPMVMGIFSPKLILPSEDYPAESLGFILRHELTHFRRNDTLYKALLLIANSLHWFNPAVWLMRKLAGSDLEVSCDAQVMNGSGIEIRKQYSETILSCVHQEKIACGVFSTHFYGGAKTLEKRLLNILSTEKRRKGTAAFIFVLILALVLGGTVACTAGSNSKGAEEPSEEKIRELVLKANAVYQPGDDSVFEIIGYENYINEHYYDEIGNFDEAVSGIFSKAGIEQLFSMKHTVDYEPVFFREAKRIHRLSSMSDSDVTNYYAVINGIALSQKRENFFRYKIEHSSEAKDGSSENFGSYVTIVFEDGKYLIEDFDPKRYTTDEAPEISPAESRAMEILHSGLDDEYIRLIQECVESIKNGTYESNPLEPSDYPEDFPPVESIPEVNDSSITLAWRDDGDEYSSDVLYVLEIDKYHAIVFEPMMFMMNPNDDEGEPGIQPAYVSAELYGYRNIYEWFHESFDGYFGIKLWLYEPELIENHIAALNQHSYGNFGAICEERYGTFLFKEYPEDITSAPDAVTFENVVYDGITDMYDGYYLDPFERSVQEVKNFSSANEMLGYMEQYIHEAMLPNPANLYGSFMEFDGKLYKTSGNVGNVGITYGNSVIISETLKHMTVSAEVYVAYSGQRYGTATIQFKEFGDDWKIVSVDDRIEVEVAPVYSAELQKASEIYNSALHSKYLARINQTIENLRNGTHKPVENHHSSYPEDFPDPKNLPDATGSNFLLAWKDSVQLDANTVQDGAVDYFYIIDDEHVLILEPTVFGYADGTESYGFANSYYLNVNAMNWISENYDGYFGGLPKEETGFSLDEIDTSGYDDVQNLGFMYVLTKTEGRRETLIWEDEYIYPGEEANRNFWLLSANGEFLNEEPFWEYNTLGNHPDPRWWVYGIRDGILYPFYINENNGEVTAEEPWGPEPQEFFGYSVYKYYWSYHSPFYGVTAPDGNEFAKPIYSRVKIPFEDRILLFSGNPQITGLQLCQILNPEKEVLSESFNYANFSVFDDGSYFGIAFCGGNGVDGHRQTYDKNGNPMPDGYWFIDKDGNIVSERYESIFVNEEWNFDSESKDDMIIAVTAGGERISFPVRDILIED
ncbi:MAG: hypothetical protein IJB66_03795 [Oscillospiraceae bacterium]|nr:hypothetical protein [Oscillospiraceae bacterium]